MTKHLQSSYTMPEGTHKGSFNVKGGCDPLWDLRYEFREVNASGPVCIIVPGHRSRGIESPGNAAVVDNVAEKVGMSVMAFDYTADQRTIKNVDPLTMDTNIADTKAVISLFGQRPHVMLARSYGFSVGLSAANEQTKGLVGALPVADLFEAMYEPHFQRKPAYLRWAYKLGFEAKMSMVGYHCWQPKKKDYTKVDFVKITRPFVRSLNDHKLPDIFARQAQRMPVRLIANEDDKVASPERTKKLERELRQAGFNAISRVVPGDNHELSEASHDAVVEAMQSFMPDVSYEAF